MIATLKANRAHSAFDVPELTRPFGAWPLEGGWDLLFSTFAQFDAVYYLAIAGEGYGAADVDVQRPAFFPLYPLAVRVLSGFAPSPGLVLVAATVVAFATFFGGLVMLRRLVELELGAQYALPTLMLLAFFPTALFFSAPYTEGLFLLVSVAAFYAARTGHWALAGLLAGAASATRVPGIALIVPLLILYLYGPRGRHPRGGERADPHNLRSRLRPRFPLRPDVLWLALAPLGLVAYSLHLQDALGDALAWVDAQETAAGRDVTAPLSAVWEGVRAAGAGAREVLEGSAETAPAGHNIVNLLFLAAAVTATVGVFRRLPPAYGAYVAAALVLPLSSPFPGEPLLSLPRFLAVLFPLFMWLALVCEERRATGRVLIVFSVLLGLFTTEFATGVWAA
jgi:hypothetical protein